MGMETKVVIKGDISHLESEISKAEGMVTSLQAEIGIHQDKLTSSTKRLSQAEKERDTALSQINAKLKPYNDELKTEGRLTAESEQALKKKTATYGQLKIQLSAIKREQTERIRTIKSEIASTRSLIQANEISAKKQEAVIDRNRKLTQVQQATTVSTKKQDHATSNLANTTIRYLRWAGTIAGVLYAGQRAWSATLGTGIKVNKMMEDNTSGIAALLSANTQMTLSNGEVVNSYQKFQIGQQIATKTMDDLRKASIKTYATFPQLTEIFQQAIGQTLAMGDSFGGTTDQIIGNTVKLAQRMSNIAGAIGMPMDRVREEIRSLLSGNASTDSLISTMIFGSPTEANKAIRDAKERGANGVTDMLNNMLKPFDALEGVDSYTRSLLQLEDAWSQAMAKMSEPVFDDLKDAFKELAIDINNESAEMVESFKQIYTELKLLRVPFSSIVEAGKYASEAFAMVAKSAEETFEILGGNTGISKLSTVILGLSVMLETVSSGLQNFGTVASNFTFSMKEGFGFDLTKANKEILTIEDILKKYENAYEKITNPKQAKKEENRLAVEQEKAVATIKEYANLQVKIPINAKLLETRTKENNKALDKTIQYQKEILKNDEQLGQLGKQYAATEDKDARAEIEKNINVYLQSNINLRRQIAEVKQKDQEKTQKALEKEASDRKKVLKDIEAESKKIESSYRKKEDAKAKKALEILKVELGIRKLNAELMNDEVAKAEILSDIYMDNKAKEYQALVEKGVMTEAQYNSAMSMEQKLQDKIVFGYTQYGQIIDATAKQMESSFGDFFDFTSDKFADFGNMANDILMQIYKQMVQMQVIKPLVGSFGGTSVGDEGSGIMGVAGQLGRLFLNAKGGAYSSPSLSAYSNQVVSQTTPFFFASGGVPNVGIMGEAGSEAIMPLTRTSGGDLGVKVTNETQPANVFINIENNTGQEVQQETTTSFDGERMIVGVILSAVDRNTMGMRDKIKGVR